MIEKPSVSRIKTKENVLSIQEINKLVDSLYKINIRCLKGRASVEVKLSKIETHINGIGKELSI